LRTPPTTQVALQVEAHAAGVAAAKAEAAEEAAAAAENGAGAGPIDEAVVEDNDVYEVQWPRCVLLPPPAAPSRASLVHKVIARIVVLTLADPE
jgi:hypothetical protein